jgi:hypothetical protein
MLEPEFFELFLVDRRQRALQSEQIRWARITIVNLVLRFERRTAEQTGTTLAFPPGLGRSMRWLARTPMIAY